MLKDIRFVLGCMVFEAVDRLHSALEDKIDSWCEEDAALGGDISQGPGRHA